MKHHACAINVVCAYSKQCSFHLSAHIIRLLIFGKFRGNSTYYSNVLNHIM